MNKIIYLLLFFSSQVFATQTIECKFSSYSDQKGNHASTLELTFIIDTSSEKAYMVGNNGSNEVIHIDRGSGKTFIEIT